MPTEYQNDERPPEPPMTAPPIVPDQVVAASVLAREQDPYLDHADPTESGPEPSVGGRLEWRRPSELLPHLGRNVGERIHQTHETAAKPAGVPVEAIPPTEQASSRGASAGAPTSRQGIARETAPSLSPLSAFGQTPPTVQFDGLSR